MKASETNGDDKNHLANNGYFKERVDHETCIQVLRQMSPEKRLMRAFELSEFARDILYHGLRKRFTDLPEEKPKELFLKRLDKCHDRNC